MTVGAINGAMQRSLRLLGAHWYAPAFLAMLGGVWWLARIPAFMRAGGEAALLFDLSLTAPMLYALCYARRQPMRTTLIRAVAIAGAGLWLAGWLIPPSEQVMLREVAPLRWIGLAAIGLVELLLLVAMIRIAFSSAGTARDVMRVSGAPLWIARLMLWEAQLWRGVWQWFRGEPRR